jgi:hypothetical protein
MRSLPAEVLCVAVCGDKLVYFGNALRLVVKGPHIEFARKAIRLSSKTLPRRSPASFLSCLPLQIFQNSIEALV